MVDFDEFMGMLDESHTKSQSKQVSTTTNLESAEPSAKNSYFGFFCSNLSGAAGEKEQVTPSVSSRQQNRQTVRRSTAAGKESEACQAILGGSWYLLTNDNLYFLLYL